MKILVVDDNPGNREILQMKLKARGYQAELAANGQQGIEKLRQDSFNLIISDLLMPEMDGYQLLYNIKADPNLKKIPFVVYTATYTDKKDEDLAFAMGASAFLIKPAEDEPFFSKMEEVLQRSASGKLEANAPSQSETKLLLDYTQRVLKKLEKKVQEANAARRQIQEMNATLEARIQTATAELEKKVTELKSLNQDLDEFAHTVSHDLRSPLRAICAFAQQLAQPDADLSHEDQQHYLNRILTSGRRMDQLIADILAYSHLKRTEVAIQPVSLEALIREAWESATDGSPAPELKILTPLPKVLGFAPVLSQVLSNLLGNALKYVEKGHTPDVRVSAMEKDGKVRVIVTDNGIGIAAQHQQRIFQTFERLHDQNSYEGSGIGLAIVHRGIEKLGGRCGVQSEPGKGSSFWFELPKA
jgi:signal transduction histidine kinase